MLKSTTKSLLEGRIILASGSPRRQELLQNLVSDLLQTIIDTLN